MVWELNYRGERQFMADAAARRRKSTCRWRTAGTYFIHGWTQVIAEVFHIDITGERFACCERLARGMKG